MTAHKHRTATGVSRIEPFGAGIIFLNFSTPVYKIE